MAEKCEYMLSKKRKIMIGVAVVVIGVCSGVFGVWKLTMSNEPCTQIIYTVNWTIEDTVTAWIIHINGTHVFSTLPNYEPNWSAYLVRYYLINTSAGVCVDYPPEEHYPPGVSRSIQSINGTPSPYNVTWNDNDLDGCLSREDNFIISKTGGCLGRAETGYKFAVVGGETGETLIEVILP